MLTHCFSKSAFFPIPVEEVFLYHTCMENICKILPDYISLKILSAPCSVGQEDMIRLNVSMYGISFLWEAEVIEYNKNVSFVDFLRHGPFALWRHHHLFEARDGGTLMTDRVEYEPPLCILGKIANRLFIRNEIERIFTVRHRKALEHFRDVRS